MPRASLDGSIHGLLSRIPRRSWYQNPTECPQNLEGVQGEQLRRSKFHRAKKQVLLLLKIQFHSVLAKKQVSIVCKLTIIIFLYHNIDETNP